jgi:predicted AAA+ superfamily ATPase
LIDHLVSNPGTLFSPRKYSRTYGLSLDSLNTYSGYLEEVFLFFPVSKFNYSVRKQQLSQKKMYLCDTGFFGGAGFRFSENKGRTYENAVFIHLKRKGEEIYYWKGKRECDFVIKSGIKLSKAIQVCYDIGPDTKEREVAGLIEAMESLRIKEGLIVTEDEDYKEKIGKMSVTYIPLWKYLLT